MTTNRPEAAVWVGLTDAAGSGNANVQTGIRVGLPQETGPDDHRNRLVNYLAGAFEDWFK